MLLAGDAIVLAGATGRVGGATLATLVREGARVLVLSRSEQRARAAIDGLLDGDEAAAAIPFACDAGDPAQTERAVAACIERFGRVDALVSLAGGSKVVPLADSSLADLRDNVRGHLETSYNLALPALRAMLAQPYREGARSRGRMVVGPPGRHASPRRAARCSARRRPR